MGVGVKGIEAHQWYKGVVQLNSQTTEATALENKRSKLQQPILKNVPVKVADWGRGEGPGNPGRGKLTLVVGLVLK